MNIMSYIFWMFVKITLTLFGVYCRMVFDLKGRRHNMTNKYGCCHRETCRSEDISISRERERG